MALQRFQKNHRKHQRRSPSSIQELGLKKEDLGDLHMIEYRQKERRAEWIRRLGELGAVIDADAVWWSRRYDGNDRASGVRQHAAFCHKG